MEAVELKPDLRSLLGDTFAFLGGVDDAAELRGRLLEYLSPPAPEVDEATVWTRKVLHAHQRAMTPPDSGWGNMSYEKGSYDHLDVFKAPRQVLSELIASKDARIQEYELEVSGLRHNCGEYVRERDKLKWDQQNSAFDAAKQAIRAEKAESELAALRAENERLKEDLERARRVQFAMESASALPKPPYESATPVPKSSIAYTTGRAAERNPAEPEHRLSGEPPLTAGEVRLPARITRRD